MIPTAEAQEIESTREPRYIGIDVESTGVDTRPLCDGGDYILEIAVVLVAADLTVIDSYTSLVAPFDPNNPGESVGVDVALFKAGTIPRDMYFVNGLWDDLRGAGELRTPVAVDQEIADFLSDYGVNETNPLPILGNSPKSIDSPMVERDMPQTAGCLTHRAADASTLYELLSRSYSTSGDADAAKSRARQDASADKFRQEDKGAVVHRALFDILASVYQIRHYSEAIHQAFIDKTGPFFQAA